MDGRTTLLWLQSAGCGGCSMSLLCAEQPDLPAALQAYGIELLWHPGLSEASGGEVIGLIDDVASGAQPLDVLCVEGAVLRGPGGSGAFHRFGGTGRPMLEVVEALAARAGTVVAVGTCAAYGGVNAAGGNPTDATGLQHEGQRPGGLLGEGFRSRSGLPVVNVAGCPTHPGWVIETLGALALGMLDAEALDPLGRPRLYSDHLVHHGCPRNEYYEFKASAPRAGDLGCLMEHLGCKATQAHGDCNIRPWNGEGSCTRGGAPCINCTAPGFEQPGHPFGLTPKVAGIPIGLPLDMPKAWFVALGSLSKAATPERLRRNAASQHAVVPPPAFPRRRR